MSSHDSPSAAPRRIRSVFQPSVPIVVNSMKSPNFIPDMPAGIEIRLRTSGTIRQNSTVQ
ncbi:hypothetical protein D3C74_495570 [compost metagenome]